MRAQLARLGIAALCVLAPLGVTTTAQATSAGGVLSVINAGDSRSTVGQPLAAPLQAHVATSSGTAESGVAVTFSLPGSGTVAGATFAGGVHSMTVRTDTFGDARTTVPVADGVTGGWLAKVSATGLRTLTIARSNQAAVADIALVGLDHALYVRRTSATAFVSLGGKLIGSPVVLRSPATAEYVLAISRTGNVWMRPVSGGAWVRIAPTTLRCTNIGAYWKPSGTLYVTCRATSGQLYTGSYDLPTGHLPSTAESNVSYRHLGAASNGAATVALPGSSAGDAASVYPVSATTVATTDLDSGTASTSTRACSSAVTAAVDSASTPAHVFYACRASNGHLHYWYATASGSSRTYDAGGKIVGTAGVATTTNGRTATVYGRSSKGQVWTSTVGIRGATTWHNLGGRAIGGIGSLGVVD